MAWIATLVILLMPIWQGRNSLALFAKYMFHGKDVITRVGSHHSAEIIDGVENDKASEAAAGQEAGKLSEKSTA